MTTASPHPPHRTNGETPGDKTDLFRQDHHYAGLFWTPVDVAGAQRDQEEEFGRNWRRRFSREAFFLLLYLPVCFIPILFALWRPSGGLVAGVVQPGMLGASLSSVLVLITAFLLYRRTVELEFHRALLDRMVATDPLTRLGNRRSMWEALEREMGRARRQDSPLTLVLMDLDRFKRVNDIHGHVVGDRVLKCFANALRTHSRMGMDFGFRIGGDEFVMIVGADVDEARAIAQRIRETFVTEAAEITAGLPLDCSMGYTARASNETLEQWVRRADVAMLRAKAGGGGQTTEEPAPEPGRTAVP